MEIVVKAPERKLSINGIGTGAVFSCDLGIFYIKTASGAVSLSSGAYHNEDTFSNKPVKLYHKVKLELEENHVTL